MRVLVLLLSVLCAATGAVAQGIMSDLMSGKLVDPEVGVFAWYDLKDNATGKSFFLRQAVVGAEQVKRKDGYWLETEIIPRVGFSTVYKMLLTGPASDPGNVHRLLVREGDNIVQEVELGDAERGGSDEDAPRERLGREQVRFPGGQIEAEHYVIDSDAGKTEIWISDKVRPMGLVRMTSPQGELSLQRYGVGGKDGESAIPAPKAAPEGTNDAATPPQGEEADDGGDDERKHRVRTNFGVTRPGRR